MNKKFATFADDMDAAKPVSDFEFDVFRQKMKNVMRNAKRHQARAIQSAKEVMLTR